MSRRIASTALAALLALVIVSCVSAPVPVPPCRRYEAVTFGPDNGFRASIPDDKFPLLDHPFERMDVAVSLVPPVSGPVTLVQIVGGKEIARWDLTLPPPTGLSTRCSVGLSVGVSSCGVTILDQPHATGGYWELQPRGNTVLEAGLSFFLCD